MTDRLMTRNKGRSASICVAHNSSSKIPEPTYLNHRSDSAASATTALCNASTTNQSDQRKSRRPASRSQSARNSASTSAHFRKKLDDNSIQTNNSISLSKRSIYNSEPKFENLTDFQTINLQKQQQNHHYYHHENYVQKQQKSIKRGTSLHGKKSGVFLQVPAHNCSSDSDENNEDCYRLRSFSFTSKGVINRGDSFRRRKSRSNSLLPQTTDCRNDSRNSFKSVASESVQPSDSEARSYQVLLLGSEGAGKTTLIRQFMMSDSINAYDSKKDFLNGQTISVMLNGEESEMRFLNPSKCLIHTSKNTSESTSDAANGKFGFGTETNVNAHPHAYTYYDRELECCDLDNDVADAFVILYSVIDKSSFLRAEQELAKLQDADLLRTKPAILVANKIDLARSRFVSPQDGKCLACTYKVKFIEISVAINHNVDELLVGLLNQIRLKSQNLEASLKKNEDHNYRDRNRNKNSLNRQQNHWYQNRNVIRASIKARQMFTWIFGKEDSKFKNCENLHIL